MISSNKILFFLSRFINKPTPSSPPRRGQLFYI
jgi:hypothetical protein